MKNEAPYLSEEHIVAWLDGELKADGEIRQALKQDAVLQTAAKEYAAISNTFATSSHDSRFVLPAAVDARTIKALKQEITRNRKVFVPERAPDAAPIAKPSTADRMRKVWVRRTSYALALALLLGGLWFGMQSNDRTPVTATNENPMTAPTTVTPDNNSVVSQQQSSSTSIPNTTVSNESRSTNREPRPVAVSHTATIPDSKAIAEAPQPTPAAAQQTAEANDPAAVMISHRYAKLIKATPTVVVSQTDKMDNM